MSNTVGTITIEMAANLAALVSDMGRAQQESARAFKGIQRQGQESFNAIKDSFKELVAAVGVGLSVDGLKEFAKAAFETAEKTENLSQSLGLTTQSLQVMGYAAGLTGNTMDVVGGAMAKLEKSAVLAASGNVQLQGVFAALGVSITDASGRIKPADQLIVEVSKHLSEFANDSEKTTAAMLLMGRGAAQNIPLLNELGTHFDELKQRAKELGLVLSDEDQKALADTQRSFNELGQEMKGLSNQFALALKPAIDEVVAAFGKLLQSSDLKAGLQEIGSAAKFVVEHMNDLYQIVKTLIEIELAGWVLNAASGLTALGVSAATTEVKILSLKAAVVGLNTAIAAFNVGSYLSKNFAEVRVAGDKLVGGLELVGNQTRGIAKEVGAFFNSMVTNPSEKEWEATLARIRGETDSNSKSILDSAKALIEYELGIGNASSATAHHSAVLKEFSVTTDESAKKHLNLADALRKESEGAKLALEDQTKLDDLINSLSQDFGPLQKATLEYGKQLDELAGFETAFYDAGKLTPELLDKLQVALDLVNQHYAEQKAIIESLNLLKQDEGTALDQILAKYQEEEDALTQGAGAHERVTAELAAEKEMRAALAQTIKDGHPLSQQEIDDAIAASKAHADHTIELKKEQAVLKEWQNIAVQGFDSVGNSISQFATGGIKTWHDFGKSLIGDAKQFIAQIIQEFLKLEVFNGIINRLFPAANLATGGVFTASGSGGFFGVGGNGGSNPISIGNSSLGGDLINTAVNSTLGGTSVLPNGGNIIGAANNAWNWLSGGGAAFDATSGMYLMPSSDALGLVPDYSGLGAAGAGGEAGTYGGVSSGGGGIGAGQVLGVAGGVVAGVNEFNAAGGGVAGVAGGLAYGIGTYFAGAAITAGLGAAAAGGLSAGLAAGMAAIPVVGWIALAAMAINMISGGKLFGTSGKPIGGAETETIGPNGASVDAHMTFKGQHALFGGSYYHDKNIPVDPAAQQAADDFFNALTKGTAAFAAQFGTTAGELVGGSFVQHFDKKGKPTTTEDTVLGVTYQGETQQQFAERLQADNFLAVLDKMGIGASTFVAGVQSDADKLFAAVQDLAGATQEAQADIKKGFSLLGSDTSIGDVIAEVIKLNDGSESLANEYTRLQQDTQSLTDNLQIAGLDIGKTGTALVEFANDAANAAGGIQNLNSLWQAYFKSYYSSSEASASQIAILRAKTAKDLDAINESAGVSMENFRKDFEAALPTLTPEQLVSWLTAAADLASLTSATDQIAAAAAKADAQFTGFMAQFKSVHYVDAFEKSLADIDAQMKANIAQATALAKADGKAGLSMQELTAIHEQAAQAAAQLVIELEASAQQLAFSLGLTTVGSLDQVNSEIARLQSESNSATSSVSNFGNAMHTAATKANDAINLLLGNLSPLNDQQKLQIALQGLRAGTVSADQVLQIGRNLYASSEAYNQLFQQVLPYANAHTGGATTGGTPGSTHSTFSSSDQARLQELLKEQAELQKAQTLSQYQTLAQQIEEIAKAKGEEYSQVLADMKVNAKDLEKGLGLADDSALKTYLDSLAHQTDSNGQNTQSIVDAINKVVAELDRIFKPIADQFKPPPNVGIPTFPNPGITQPPVAPPPATPPPTGGSGGGDGPGRGGSHQYPSADSIGYAVASHVDRLVNDKLSRSNRPIRVY